MGRRAHSKHKSMLKEAKVIAYTVSPHSAKIWLPWLHDSKYEAGTYRDGVERETFDPFSCDWKAEL